MPPTFLKPWGLPSKAGGAPFSPSIRHSITRGALPFAFFAKGGSDHVQPGRGSDL
jgi:hypothetical protein